MRRTTLLVTGIINSSPRTRSSRSQTQLQEWPFQNVMALYAPYTVYIVLQQYFWHINNKLNWHSHIANKAETVHNCKKLLLIIQLGSKSIIYLFIWSIILTHFFSQSELDTVCTREITGMMCPCHITQSGENSMKSSAWRMRDRTGHCFYFYYGNILSNVTRSTTATVQTPPTEHKCTMLE